MATRRGPALPRRAVPAFASRRAAPDEAARERREEPGAAGALARDLPRSWWCAAPSSPAFPGETEAEFEHLLDFLREAQIDRAGCFAYSAVDGAARERAARACCRSSCARSGARASWRSPKRCRSSKLLRARRRDDAGAGRFGAGAGQQGRGAAAATPTRRRSTAGSAAAAGEGLEDAEGGRVHARQDRRRRRPRPGRRSRSECCMAEEEAAEQHRADRTIPTGRRPASVGAAGRAQGVDGALREHRRAARARPGRRRPATPTACTARRRPSSLEERIATLEGGAADRCSRRAAWRRSRWSTRRC